MHITQKVIVEVRKGGGWFLRYDEQLQGWASIDEQAARKKVSQAIQYRRRKLNNGDSTSEFNYDGDLQSNTAIEPSQYTIEGDLNPMDSFNESYFSDGDIGLASYVSIQRSSQLDDFRRSASTSNLDEIVTDAEIYESLGIVFDNNERTMSRLKREDT